jgi:hypothetical protein
MPPDVGSPTAAKFVKDAEDAEDADLLTTAAAFAVKAAAKAAEAAAAAHEAAVAGTLLVGTPDIQSSTRPFTNVHHARAFRAMAAAVAAADFAAKAAEAAGSAADSARAARSDLHKLTRLNLGKFLALGANIDPSDVGPLGRLWSVELTPFAEPTETDSAVAAPSPQKTAESQPERLVLEAVANEPADTEEVAKVLAGICYALNAYHIARGGNGLVIDHFEVRVATSIPAEAR